MTLAEILAEVYTITARPDLVDLTKLAVRSATLKAHNLDFFSKDIYEESYQFDEASFKQSLDYISLIPNYRALKYLRLYDTASATAGEFIPVITPEELLDAWHVEKTNVCYVAGRVLEIKANVAFDTILLGCYVNPIVTENNYSSWIATLYPYAIIHEAARQVFAMIAQKEESNSQEKFVAEQYSELKLNALTDVGY